MSEEDEKYYREHNIVVQKGPPYNANRDLGMVVGEMADSPGGALENMRLGRISGIEKLSEKMGAGFKICTIANVEIHQSFLRKYLWSKQEIRYFGIGEAYFTGSKQNENK